MSAAEVGVPDIDVVASRSLVAVLRLIFEPFEDRKRARSKVQQAKFEETSYAIIIAIAYAAVAGRGSLRVELSNAHLKRRGGPGLCLRSILYALRAAGLIQMKLGYFDRRTGRRRRTKVRATPYFRAMMMSVGITPSHSECPTVTTLLNGKKAVLTETLRESDAVIRRFNALAAQGHLTLPQGVSPPDNFLVRKLKGGVECGGRLYGGWWQELPETDRARLLIDGEPVVELDFKAMQPRILFARQGIRLDFDPYLVSGSNVDRKAGKLVYHRLVNGKRSTTSKRKCPLNFQKEFKEWFADKDSFNGFVAELEFHLKPISHYFGPEAWMSLQFEESELAIAILATCLDEGIMVYLIHDSFVTKEADHVRVHQIMLDAFLNRYGITAEGGISL
ncbi:MAG: hypothetical protein EON58_13410 [Alphaproteobacteria bacterium]|nr:MAG: hypothetical protein EON58_13410 [Alphaproteobacteria bacterium]